MGAKCLPKVSKALGSIHSTGKKEECPTRIPSGVTSLRRGRKSEVCLLQPILGIQNLRHVYKWRSIKIWQTALVPDGLAQSMGCDSFCPSSSWKSNWGPGWIHSCDKVLPRHLLGALGHQQAPQISPLCPGPCLILSAESSDGWRRQQIVTSMKK